MSDRLIFICYSRKDKKWKELLEEQLGVLEQQGSLAVWSDSDIGAGEDWYQKILDALQKACVAVLLVSAGSLNSKFILREEVVRLLKLRDEEGLRIFPIIATDCLWEEVEWLSRMQVRPRDRRPLQEKSAPKKATELRNVAAEIAKIVGASAKLASLTGSQGPREPQNRAPAPESSTKADEEDSQKLREKLRKMEAKLAAAEKELKLTKATPTSAMPSEYQGKELKPSGDLPLKPTGEKPQFLKD